MLLGVGGCFVFGVAGPVLLQLAPVNLNHLASRLGEGCWIPLQQDLLYVGRDPSVWRLGFRCLCAVSRRWIHRPVIASAAPSKAASSEGHRGDWDPKSREDRKENLASGRLPSFVLLWQLQAGETSGRDPAERERAKTCTWSCTGPSARSPGAHPLGWWGA